MCVCVYYYLLHGHAAAEHGGDGEVATVSRIAGGHHVLGVEHLLDELGHRERAVLLTAARRQRSEAGHEEVEARERHHVHCQLAQVGVQLTTDVAQMIMIIMSVNLSSAYNNNNNHLTAVCPGQPR